MTLGYARDDIGVLKGAIEYLTRWKTKEAMDLTLKPKNQHILGKIIDVKQSKGGIVLPTSEVKNVTVFVLVKHIGPDVKNCKIGDVVLYLRMNHLWLRDGTHWCQVKDEDVICVVEDLDMSLFAVEGETRVDGQPYVPTQRPTA